MQNHKKYTVLANGTIKSKASSANSKMNRQKDRIVCNLYAIASKQHPRVQRVKKQRKIGDGLAKRPDSM